MIILTPMPQPSPSSTLCTTHASVTPPTPCNEAAGPSASSGLIGALILAAAVCFFVGRWDQRKEDRDRTIRIRLDRR